MANSRIVFTVPLLNICRSLRVVVHYERKRLGEWVISSSSPRGSVYIGVDRSQRQAVPGALRSASTGRRGGQRAGARSAGHREAEGSGGEHPELAPVAAL